MMDIKQLTANIHCQQLQLEQQINHLQQQLAAAQGESAEKLAQELGTLKGLQQKLMKSHDMAVRAHALQVSQSGPPQNPKRIVGIALCAFSGLGLLALLIIALLL